MRNMMLALACWLLASCGTLCTAVEDGRGCAKLAPYSGTKASAQGHATQLDVPFSFLADTLLLPITLLKALFNGSNKETEAAQPVDEPGN